MRYFSPLKKAMHAVTVSDRLTISRVGFANRNVRRFGLSHYYQCVL
jgi:hypothetical protein